MPLYRFRTFPPDEAGEAVLSFNSDDEAIDEANRTLGDLLLDAASQGRPAVLHIEVCRDDGSLLTRVTP